MEVINELAAINRRIEAIAAGPVEPRIGFEVAVASFEAHRRIAQPIDGTYAQIDRIVRSNAAAARIDPELIEAIIANESGFATNAISKAGARGLMQLMPETAASLGVVDPFDPRQNVAGGTRYLRALLDRFGDVEQSRHTMQVPRPSSDTAAFRPLPRRGSTSIKYRRAITSF